MSVLVINTASHGVTVGIHDAGQGVLAAHEFEEGYGQGDMLVPLIEKSLSESGLSYADVKIVGVTKGPGSFTGLRTGLAAASMLRSVLGIPVVGICSFEAIRQTYLLANNPQQSEDVIAVVLDTKRDDFYVQIFDSEQPLPDPQVMGFDALMKNLSDLKRDVTIIGDAPVREWDGFQVIEIKKPSIEAMAMLAAQQADFDLVPVYLRPADVTLPVSAK